MRSLKDALSTTLVGNFPKGEFKESFLYKECSVFYIDEAFNVHFSKNIEFENTELTLTGSCFILDQTIMIFSIRKSYQKLGYGHKLLSEVCNNFNILELHVRISNSKAINLYTKNNFVVVEAKENFYSHTSKNESSLKMIRVSTHVEV